MDRTFENTGGLTRSEILELFPGSTDEIVTEQQASLAFVDPYRPTKSELITLISNRQFLENTWFSILKTQDNTDDHRIASRWQVVRDENDILNPRGGLIDTVADYVITIADQTIYFADPLFPTNDELLAAVNGLSIQTGAFFVLEEEHEFPNFPDFGIQRIRSRWQVVYNAEQTGILVRQCSIGGTPNVDSSSAIPQESLDIIDAKEAAGATFTDGQKEAYHSWVATGLADGWWGKGRACGIFTDGVAAANLINVLDTNILFTEVGGALTHTPNYIQSVGTGIDQGAIDLTVNAQTAGLTTGNMSLALYMSGIEAAGDKDIGAGIDGGNGIYLGSTTVNVQFYYGEETSSASTRANRSILRDKEGLFLGNRLGDDINILFSDIFGFAKGSTRDNNPSVGGIPNDSLSTIGPKLDTAPNGYYGTASNSRKHFFAWMGLGMTLSESRSFSESTSKLIRDLV